MLGGNSGEARGHWEVCRFLCGFSREGDLIPTQLWALFNYFWGFLQLSAHGLHDIIT